MRISVGFLIFSRRYSWERYVYIFYHQYGLDSKTFIWKNQYYSRKIGNAIFTHQNFLLSEIRFGLNPQRFDKLKKIFDI